MPRRRQRDQEEEEEVHDDYYGGDHGGTRGKKRLNANKKRPRLDDDEEEEEEEDNGRHGRLRKRVQHFIEDDVSVDDDEEEDEEDEEIESGFIDTQNIDLEDDEEDAGTGRRNHRVTPLIHDQDDLQEDVDALERRIQERYGMPNYTTGYDEELATTDVDQQALLPSVKDPKLWMVKCMIGHEREVAACLMQKCIDKGNELQIMSAIALDHLKNYVYIEAYKEAHVKEACKGMLNIYTGSKILLVPIKEMTDVLSVKSKETDLCLGTLVRMKIGTYKGDLAKVADVDNVRHRVTVKLLPRIDFQALANKLDGKEALKKKMTTPPARLFNIAEASKLHIRVERRLDRMTGDYFDIVDDMRFKDGFLYKTVSLKSVSYKNIHPTLDELDKFKQYEGNEEGDRSSLYTSRKKGHFLKGDKVICMKGDLRNLKGTVEKVEEDIVLIKPNEFGLQNTVAVSEKELCKYFEKGDQVKIMAGEKKGATGMVLDVDGGLVNILSDSTQEVLRIFSDNVVKSSEVTTGITRLGEYELHDLVQLHDSNFGVIIRVESGGFSVLKCVSGRAEVDLVKLGDIKDKIFKNNSARDHVHNIVSVRDVVKVIDGPSKGRKGHVEHIYRGILFIYDRHHLEHGGYFCAKSQLCILVGGSWTNGDRNGNALISGFSQLRTTSHVPQSPGWMPKGGAPISNGRHGGGRGPNSLVGTCIKVRAGHYKGQKGRVLSVKGTSVCVELETQVKVVTVDRAHIRDDLHIPTPWNCRDRSGSVTSVHPSRTPLRPCMTPIRDPGATPIHERMRTPVRGQAWNLYEAISPTRMVHVDSC